ncbi:sulfurtransferase [Synechococcus elongatus]|uniref:Sulfurtransferase n=1 Tax=Synechococcus elongatus PCC 11802 TaxID=2283154 RepID=A0AAT9JWK7_SYNEL|nr:sulfurtransferase [Synechococcus elongatus]QFZ92082.1 sulfurtransferase [Synechococcus elongatus PCC 11802]
MSVRSLRWPRQKAFLAVVSVAVALLLALPGFFQPVAAAPSATVQFVSPAWVAERLNTNKLKILDVRTNPLAYIEGHLPGAVNIADSAYRGPNGFLPVQIWDAQKLADLFGRAGVKNSDSVLVYSDGNDILGATQVAYLLERSGVKDIAVLDGGYKGYKDAGFPVTKEYPRYSLVRFTPKDNREFRVDIKQVEQLIGKSTFVDPRPPALFSGEQQVFIRNGHIPGARNIPWPTFTEANNPNESLKNPHKLKPLSDLKAILEAKGVTPDKDVIVTCSTGREASLQYLVLKHLLKYPNVRIYEGSWTEYSASKLPVATGPDRS